LDPPLRALPSNRPENKMKELKTVKINSKKLQRVSCVDNMACEQEEFTELKKIKEKNPDLVSVH
jgi:hypothetical protein